MKVTSLVLVCLLAQVAGAEPTVVVGYRNGKPMQLEVTEIDGIVLEVTTARAWIALRDAAVADDIYLEPWSGFRDNERQTELYEDWKGGYGVRAAKPGYSNHQSGVAIDIAVSDVSDDAYVWLAKNASRYGFRRTVPDEPWHWEYSPPRKVVVKKAVAKKPVRR